MTILYIYLGVTTACYVTSMGLTSGYINKLEKEGYEFNNRSNSLMKKLFNSDAALISVLPVVHIIVPAVMMYNKDEWYEGIKKILLEEEIIRLATDKESDTEIEENNTNDAPKVNNEKNYDDMTNEEKITYLKEERDALINIEENTDSQNLEEDFTTKGHALVKTFNQSQK